MMLALVLMPNHMTYRIIDMGHILTQYALKIQLYLNSYSSATVFFFPATAFPADDLILSNTHFSPNGPRIPMTR